MDVDEVLDSYVHDVVRRLPPRRRGDVALELRLLLAEELADRAAAESRPADADLATRLLRDHGRPADVAARYHEPLILIRPGDTGDFLVAAVVGTAILSVSASPSPPGDPTDAVGRALVAWLAWLGLLVVAFAARSLLLHHRPDALGWTPRRLRRDHPRRVPAALAGLAWAAALVVYLAPGPVTAAVTLGRVHAGTLAYSTSFLSAWRMPWLVGVLALLTGLHLSVAAQGRPWQPRTRWARLALTVLAASQLGWHARYGSVFADHATDTRLAPVVAGLSAVAWTLAILLMYREYLRVPAIAVTSPVAPAG